MAEISPPIENEIREMVLGFFAEECDVERAKLTEQTNIIEELEGDSLMFLSLLEKVRKRYGIGVELKTLARHLMKYPASTIGQVVRLSVEIVRHNGNVADLQLG
jgi:acyl carrier protein